MPDYEYLPDPEEQAQSAGDISSELVKAATEEDAEEICQDKANEYNLELIEVEHRGQSWWDCIFGEQQ
ncbi:MAG TPA: hypothetical protein V6D33_09025 [Cyanophyceae cyanobacterium]